MRKDLSIYGAFFEESLSPMIVVNPETGLIVEANRAACRFYGYSHDRLVAMHIADINYLDATSVNAEMARARDMRANHFHFRHRLASGELRDVDVYSSPIVVEGRRLLASVIHDVTEHGNTRRALDQAAERLQIIMSTTMDGVLMLNLDLRIVEVNERFAAIIGYGREELLQMRITELESGRTAEEVSQDAATTMEHGYHRFETRFRAKGGRVLDVEISSTYVSSSECFFVLFRNITERKLSERRLSDTLELNEKIVSVSPIGMLAYKASGMCVLANPAAEVMVGAPASVLRTQDFHNLPSWRTSGLYDEAVEALQTGEARIREIYIRTTFERERWVQATLVKFMSQDEPHLLVLWLDITEQKRLLETEQANARAAQELATLRDEFVGTVSHELRSPLTAIVGYSELLDTHWDRIAEAQKRDRIRRIMQAGNRQLRLVEDLLLISRLDYGAMRLQVGRAGLPALIQRAVDEVLAAYPSQQIDLAGPAETAIRADPDRMVQILVNLIDNAAKYSPEGESIGITWETRYPSEAPSGAAGTLPMVIVHVKDHGPGLPIAGRERLFERFGRLEGSRSRSGHVGTGLGLYLSRTLAHAMHGDLDVEATGPDGSIFRLCIPAALS